MNPLIKEKVDLFEENLKIMNKSFWLENSHMMVISASTLTKAGVTADKDKLKGCLDILKKKMGVLSDFRGTNEKYMITKMSLQEDPEAYLDQVITVYDKIQKGKIIGSTYNVISAITICETGMVEEADRLIEKAETIVSAMKKKHKFLASDHDICFAILLAMKEKSVEDVVEEVDEMYRILKERFAFHDSAVYSLCQVLAVYEGTPAEKCEKVTDIYNELKDAGVKYGKEYELASLGTLIDVNLETKALAAEIEETDQYLKTKKGFGFLDMGKETRYMYSAMLVSDCYAKEGTNNRVAVMEGTVAMVVEEEVALMIMMMSMLTVTTIINN